MTERGKRPRGKNDGQKGMCIWARVRVTAAAARLLLIAQVVDINLGWYSPCRLSNAQERKRVGALLVIEPK